MCLTSVAYDLQDGVTGFHCGQIDPDKLLASDVDALAGAVNRFVIHRKLHAWHSCIDNCHVGFV